MENVLKLLIAVAGDLDQQGLIALADKVDAIANGVLDVKTAQYVGIQGYWIRNSRCWANCYRKKRTETPTKAAQQVWTECHEEYVESINDDNSKWNKYAEKEGLVKVAGIESAIIDQKQEFAKNIQNKVSLGIDLGSAIFASLDEKTNLPQEKLIEASNQLLTIANDLVANPDLSFRLSEAADQLVREAGMLGGFGRAIGDKFHGLKMDWNVGSYIQNMDKAINSITQALRNFESQKSNLIEYLNNFTPRNGQQAASLQQVLSGMNSFKVVSPQAVSSKWDGIKQIVNGLANSNQPSASPAASSPAPPTSGMPAPATPPAAPATPPAAPATPYCPAQSDRPLAASYRAPRTSCAY